VVATFEEGVEGREIVFIGAKRDPVDGESFELLVD
jgi:hypothetical protein